MWIIKLQSMMYVVQLLVYAYLFGGAAVSRAQNSSEIQLFTIYDQAFFAPHSLIQSTDRQIR